MMIYVELFATLRRYLPAPAQQSTGRINVPEGSTIADLARALGIPAGLETLALVNGHESDESGVLADGDTVALYPPLAGGAERGRLDDHAVAS